MNLRANAWTQRERMHRTDIVGRAALAFACITVADAVGAASERSAVHSEEHAAKMSFNLTGVYSNSATSAVDGDRFIAAVGVYEPAWPRPPGLSYQDAGEMGLTVSQHLPSAWEQNNHGKIADNSVSGNAHSAVQHSVNQSEGDLGLNVQSHRLSNAKDPANAFGDNIGSAMSDTAETTVVIEAPKAGDTLVSRTRVALEVQTDLVDTVRTRACQSFGVRVTAQGGTSILQLHRELLYARGNPTRAKVEAVAPEPGVWTLNAVFYCSFESLTASILSPELGL